MSEKRKPDEIDAALAANRQGIILVLLNSGKLDAESAAGLYEDTTRPDIVEADREGAENGFGPDSPSGILATLWFKLTGRG